MLRHYSIPQPAALQNRPLRYATAPAGAWLLAMPERVPEEQPAAIPETFTARTSPAAAASRTLMTRAILAAPMTTLYTKARQGQWPVALQPTTRMAAWHKAICVKVSVPDFRQK